MSVKIDYSNPDHIRKVHEKAAKMGKGKIALICNHIVEYYKAVKPAEADFIKGLLADYEGKEFILFDILSRTNSLDPIEAVNSLKIKEFKSRTKNEDYFGESISGQKLTKGFMVQSDLDPSRPFPVGIDMMIPLLKTFSTGEKRKEFGLEGSLLDEKILEVENHFQDLFKQSRSGNYRSDRHVRELEDRLAHYANLLDGNIMLSANEAKEEFMNLRRGGAFWRYFEDQLEDLPVHIRDAYTTLRDPHINMGNREIAAAFDMLYSFKAENCFMKTEEIAGSYKRDLEFVLSNEGEMNLPPLKRQRVEPLLNKPDINLLEFKALLDSYDFITLRRTMYDRAIQEWGDDLADTFSLANLLFTNGVELLPDSYKDQVPMKRLKNNWYYAALGRDQFKILMDYSQRYCFDQMREPELLYSVSDFMQASREMVLMNRKVSLLIDLAKQNGIEVEDLDDDSFDIVSKFDFIRKTKFDLIESQTFDVKHIIDVLENSSANFGEYADLRSEIVSYTNHGLLHPKVEYSVLNRKIKKYSESKPDDSLDALLGHPILSVPVSFDKSGKEISKSPLFGNSMLARLLENRPKYTTESEESLLRELGILARALSRTKFLNHGEYQTAIRELIKNPVLAVYDLNDPRDPKSLTKTEFDLVFKVGSRKLVDPIKLNTLMDEVEHSISFTDLAESFWSKYELIRKHGDLEMGLHMNRYERGAYLSHDAQNIFELAFDVVNKEANEFYQSGAATSCIPKLSRQLLTSDLDEQYRVRFTVQFKFKDKFKEIAKDLIPEGNFRLWNGRQKSWVDRNNGTYNKFEVKSAVQKLNEFNEQYGCKAKLFVDKAK